MRETPPITPTEDPDVYRLKTHVPRSAIEELEMLAIVEGFNQSTAFHKALKVYDFFHENTIGIGTSMYGSASRSHLGAEKIPTPRSYLKSRALSMGGTYGEVDFPIAAATSEILGRHMLENKVDFRRLFVGAVGYYGMIASHLYAEHNILVKTPFKQARAVKITQTDIPTDSRVSE
jgi:hypothetical protein